MTIAARVAAVGLVGLALTLRLHHLGMEELWLDEAFSYRDVTVATWLHDLRLKDVPPLYPMLLRAWIGLAGDGEAALRALSAVSGTLFVAATMWAGRELFDARTALWSGLVAAISPIAVYYAQEVRPYALLAALVACTWALMSRALRLGTPSAWALAVLAVAAVLHTHYLGGLAILPMALLAASTPHLGSWRRGLVALAAGGLLFAPWVLWSFVLTTHPFGGTGWIGAAWASTPPWLALPRSLEVLLLGGEAGRVPITLKQFDTLAFPALLRTVCLGAFVALALASIVRAGGHARRLRVVALWVALLFPVLLLWTASWVTPLYLVGRYDQLALPPLVLLCGVGLARIAYWPRRRALAVLVTLGLLGPMVVKLGLYFREPARNLARSRSAARAVAAHVATGDLVLFTDLRGHTVGYQLAQLGWHVRDGWCTEGAAGRRVGCHAVPRQMGPLPVAEDWARVASDPTLTRTDLEEYLGALPPAHNRAVHVVLSTWSVDAGAVSVSTADAALLRTLETLGFRMVGFDPDVGVAVYRVSVARR